jgi:catechol 2,3-dioxygenase-like lactoylglutathione lyase family enzyme
MTTNPAQFSAIGAIGQVGIVSAKAGELVAFYRDVLGLPLLFEAGGMSFLQAGGVRVMIGAGEPITVSGDVILYFEPTDWSAAVAALEAKGVGFTHDAVVVQREPGREHVLRPFRDPEGRPLYLLGWRAAQN